MYVCMYKTEWVIRKTSPKAKPSKTNKYNISIVQHLYHSKNESSGSTLREKYPNTDQKKLRIWALFTLCLGPYFKTYYRTLDKKARGETCARSQETKKLIIKLKVQTIRIQSFKVSHPIVLSWWGQKLEFYQLI